MLAFVAGGAVGLIPFDGRVGIAVAATLATLAAARGVILARRLHSETLRGRSVADASQPPAAPTSPAPGQSPPTTETRDRPLAPPGYHIYRPSPSFPSSGSGDDESSRESRGPK
jgi:hypothetical protein